MKDIIRIKNLSKYYGKQRGIDDISFEVKEGEIFGFIGPNGSGKSTTIRTILGLIHPSGGAATIFDWDCIKERAKIAEEVGYLPSEVFYYDHMKVKDLFTYSASFYKKDCMPHCQELCKRLELDVDRKIEDLSFGNRKKVGIVQCLMHAPKLIILDEPTSGLDPLMQNIFFEILEEENKRGATILLSSHVLQEVQRMCNRVAIIKDGKIVKIEKIRELKDKSCKRVMITTSDAKGSDLSKIDGIRSWNQKGDHIHFMYQGNFNLLFKELALLNIEGIDISEPDLEEIFMQFYHKEEQV